jgi:hypothetical protein
MHSQPVDLLILLMVGAASSLLAVSLIKAQQRFRRWLEARLLEPYYAHRAALGSHHDVAGMPLIIYIAYQLARLVTYTAGALLFYSGGAYAFAMQRPANWLVTTLVCLALVLAVVYFMQALRALLALKLLYVNEVDPLVKRLTPEKRDVVRRAMSISRNKQGD